MKVACSIGSSTIFLEKFQLVNFQKVSNLNLLFFQNREIGEIIIFLIFQKIKKLNFCVFKNREIGEIIIFLIFQKIKK